MFDIENYEKECHIIREENNGLLDLFAEDMEAQGLKKNTINKHLGNVDFYINEYLLREDANRFDKGLYLISDFLGYFFIRKCMWSTPGTIKTTASSIKKFYKCMLDNKKIDSEDYKELCSTMKEGLIQWMDDCEQYNNPDAWNPFSFW